jgi:hypothetical protein
MHSTKMMLLIDSERRYQILHEALVDKLNLTAALYGTGQPYYEIARWLAEVEDQHKRNTVEIEVSTENDVLFQLLNQATERALRQFNARAFGLPEREFEPVHISWDGDPVEPIERMQGDETC